MPPPPPASVSDDLPDPRREAANKLHRPTDILTIATRAIIAGAESRGAIAEYGRTERGSFGRPLRLEDGVPGPDTFERVFTELAPAALAQAFGRWMAACEATGPIPIAIDGESARSAKRGTATGCPHAVTAWAAENRPALGAAAVPDGSDEIAAIPELLRTPDLAGAIVTIDAAGRRAEDARIIRERDGHHLPTVEDDRPNLRADVEAVSDRACEADFAGVRSDGHESDEDAHGRHEEGDVTVVYDPTGPPPGWPDVAAVVPVDREREVAGERTTTSHRYLTGRAGKAAEFAGWIRGRLDIEDGLHRALDVVSREDRSRIRREHAGADLAMTRRVAVSPLRRAHGKGRG